MPPAYQLPVASVDYLAFESRLTHRSVKRGRVNRMYTQIHNRGIDPATDVVVKILYADATTALPDLPSDFWARFPDDSLDPASLWTPIGAYRNAPAILPTRPAVLEWNWTPSMATAEHSCLLVVVDSATDPIPSVNRVTSIGTLIATERHVGLRNLHVVDAPPGILTLGELTFRALSLGDRFWFHLPSLAGWSLGVLLPAPALEGFKGKGIKRGRVTKEMRTALALRREQRGKRKGGADATVFDDPVLLTLDKRGEAVFQGLKPAKRGMIGFLVAQPTARAGETTVTIAQEGKEAVLGGNTFVLRPAKARR
jgi:hypothetical protein